MSELKDEHQVEWLESYEHLYVLQHHQDQDPYERLCEPAGVGANEQQWHNQVQLNFRFNEDLAEKVAEVNHQIQLSLTSTAEEMETFKLGLRALNLPGQWIRTSVKTAEVADTPPRTAKFLLLLIPKKNREGILGDLEEEYRTILLPEYGLRLARFYYWWHSLLTGASFLLAGLQSLSRSFKRN